MRRDAESLAGPLPPLLSAAERLAATVILGAHGRRRPGAGETFWQYRRAAPGDSAASIDWRRSARSDALFVRETEWEAAQTVWLWCDRSAAMDYAGPRAGTTKRARAATLTLALAILLTRAGERVALLNGDGAARPSASAAQLERMALMLAQPEPEAEFGAPPPMEPARGGKAVFVSDFFGETAPLEAAVGAAAARGLPGMMLQVLDPSEESFPFKGRVIFESMARSLRYETDRADALKADYQAALARRRDALTALARSAGWRFSAHRTDESAAAALLWLAQGLSGGFDAGIRRGA
ncbi:MAG: DUF58 domain-containing protein [Pseudomonadota bacterium]